MQLSTLSSKILGRIFSEKIKKSSTLTVMIREWRAKRHIPHICQLFNMDKFFGSQVLHLKTTKNTKNTTEITVLRKIHYSAFNLYNLVPGMKFSDRHCL